jgi:hypothetical protein
VHGDARSRRVAVVPDALLNPPDGAPDRLAALAAAGWGVVALPPAGLPDDALAGWRQAVLDEVTTFLDGGYEVALVGPDDPEAQALAEGLRAAGRGVPAELAAPL